jgi:hypothetical protein
VAHCPKIDFREYVNYWYKGYGETGNFEKCLFGEASWFQNMYIFERVRESPLRQRLAHAGDFLAFKYTHF